MSAALGGAALLSAAALSCRRAPRETFLTYFNAEYRVSVRHPASWRTEQAVRERIWYRHFLGPPEGGQGDPGVAATLLAGPLGGSLEEYAQVYLAGNSISSSREESRQGARGKSYLYASADGRKRHWLLLLDEGGTVFGLYALGGAAPFERQRAVLQQMVDSLTLERPGSYPELRDEAFGFALGLPGSWQSTRRLSSGDRLAVQLLSPALRAERSSRTVHASLTLSVEPIASDDGLAGFYAADRRRLGDSYQVLDHVRWKDGYADVVHTETPISVSRLKRFYRVSGARGYGLSFEAREDVFHDVATWFDLIASTLKVGPELNRPPN